MELDDSPPEQPVRESEAENSSPTSCPIGQPVPGKLPSIWDIIAERQDALKEAAWQAYDQHEQVKQEALLEQYLASEDPQFCADYLSMPIDSEVAAYEFPAEDPPLLPAKQRTKPAQTRGVQPRRRKEKAWREVPLVEPYSYQDRRYMAWVFYHLKRDDLLLQEKILAKQTKIESLRSDLAGEHDRLPFEAYLPDGDQPKVPPQVKVVEFDLLAWIEKVREVSQEHAHADENMAPRRPYAGQSLRHPSYVRERGPP